MSTEAFVLARVGSVPNAHIARQAGCSESLVRRIADLAAVPYVPPPAISPPPPPVGARRVPVAALRVWRTSLPPDVRRTIKEVADRHRVTVRELTDSADRRGNIPLCAIRQEAYWAVYQIPERDGGRRYGTPLIGSFFGGRDHTTVMHGVRQHEKRLAAMREQRAA